MGVLQKMGVDLNLRLLLEFLQPLVVALFGSLLDNFLLDIIDNLIEGDLSHTATYELPAPGRWKLTECIVIKASLPRHRTS